MEFKKPQVAYLQSGNLAKCNPGWQLVSQHLQANFENAERFVPNGLALP